MARRMVKEHVEDVRQGPGPRLITIHMGVSNTDQLQRLEFKLFGLGGVYPSASCASCSVFAAMTKSFLCSCLRRESISLALFPLGYGIDNNSPH